MLGKSCWISLKADISQVLLSRAFEQSIATGEAVKPWGWADTWPVAEIRVPRLGVSEIILHGSSTEALAFGPSHLPNTAAMGESGTSVVAAHRDTHFKFLKDIEVSDRIEIKRGDGLIFTYVVQNLRVAQWDHSGIDRHAAGHNLVLTTCFPFDGMTRGEKRFIVEARLED